MRNMNTVKYKEECKCRQGMGKYDRPIVIPKLRDDSAKRANKRFYRETFEKDKPSFTDSFIELKDEKKLDRLNEFHDYCLLIGLCSHCNKRIGLTHFRANEYNEIVMECKDYCLSTTIEASAKSKDYVIWFNRLLADYGLAFTDGFPVGIKARYGTKCLKCGGSRVGGITYFSFVKD